MQTSHLNLVDLAGSERAEQTGATGSRFKEGVHINKSLFSLGLVIQKLSEKSEGEPNTHIPYRDSKLTRILQQSLGGNAMSAIICTVTPAAHDETYNTLQFGQRANTIKNKPIVNENQSDSVMMKKLEKEVARLKHQEQVLQEQLKKEKSKNSEIQIHQLQKQILEREQQFLNSHNNANSKNGDANRRRTWCYTSTFPDDKTNIPQTAKKSDNCLMPPPPPFFDVSKGRKTTSPTYSNKLENNWMEDEDFKSGEECIFDRTLSPTGSEACLNLIRTPKEMRPRRSLIMESPDPGSRFDSPTQLKKR